MVLACECPNLAASVRVPARVPATGLIPHKRNDQKLKRFQIAVANQGGVWLSLFKISKASVNLYMCNGNRI
jgi:hypothetical protein